jgi:hypothetical protein
VLRKGSHESFYRSYIRENIKRFRLRILILESSFKTKEREDEKYRAYIEFIKGKTHKLYWEE